MSPFVNLDRISTTTSLNILVSRIIVQLHVSVNSQISTCKSIHSDTESKHTHTLHLGNWSIFLPYIDIKRTKYLLSQYNSNNNLQDLKAEAIQFWDEKPWLMFHPRIENYVSAMYLRVLKMVLSVSKTNLPKFNGIFQWPTMAILSLL